MRIDDLPFAVKAIVGRAELPLAAYHALQIGDILLLNQEVGTPMPIEVGEKQRFLATPGLYETRKAVKIDERIHE